jgi:drug/metabolite transporter (DMT)-like permease
MEKRTEKYFLIYIMSGAFLISFSGVWVKIAHTGPTVSAFYRVLIGGLALLLIVKIKKEPLWKGLPNFLSSVLCGFFFALDLFVWHRSILYIGPGLATILSNFQVFLVALFGILVLKERISLRLLLAIPIAVFGLFLVVGVNWSELSGIYKTGIILGFATALCYAFYLLTLRKIQASDKPLSASANMLVISLSTAFFLAVSLAYKHTSISLPDMQTVVSLFSYAVFSQVAGWVLISKGLPYVRASLAALLLLTQPTFAFIWDILFFSRETSLLNGAGAVLTLAAIYMGSTSKRQS